MEHCFSSPKILKNRIVPKSRARHLDTLPKLLHALMAAPASPAARQQANAALVAELQEAIGPAAYTELREWSSLYRQGVATAVGPECCRCAATRSQFTRRLNRDAKSVPAD